MSTSTPSGDQTRSMARATSAASVPSGLPGRSRPPATAMAQIGAGHLGGQLGHALGEPRAVAHQNESDHEADPANSVAAAVSSSSQDEVAPGSCVPALRSPR